VNPTAPRGLQWSIQLLFVGHTLERIRFGR
jgi:hypothetical protein